MSKAADSRLLNVAEVAERLGVSERFVRRLVRHREATRSHGRQVARGQMA
jgi:excisionase family DNA binding protein